MPEQRASATGLQAGVPWAGLAAGPAAWAVSTQLNYALASWACARGAALVVAGLALLFVLAALGGGLLSWRAWRATPAAPREEGGRPHHFLAAIGILTAVLFALVILMQGVAGLVFSGCEW